MRIIYAIYLFFYFIVALIRSTWSVVLIVIGPRKKFQPAIVAVPVNLKTEISVTTLANLITLTPGTLTLDVSPDGKTLFIHCLDLGSSQPEDLRNEINNGFERIVRKVFE